MVRRMDPEETFNAMMEAFAYGLHDEAEEYARNLQEWLDKGGFAPSFWIAVGDRSSFSAKGTLAREFCQAACQIVLAAQSPQEPSELLSQEL